MSHEIRSQVPRCAKITATEASDVLQTGIELMSTAAWRMQTVFSLQTTFRSLDQSVSHGCNHAAR